MLVELLKTLHRHDVDFVVCGGVACVLHGVSRVTNDVDLFINLDEANLERFVDAARELQLSPRIPEPIDAILDPDRRNAWLREKNATVYTLIPPNSHMQVDVFLAYPIAFADLKARANRMQSEDVTFLASSKEDLITAKRHVQPMRRIDERDIQDLQELIERERAS